MEKNCLYCKNEFGSFEERVAQIVRMGWSVKSGEIDRKGFEKKVIENIVSTMGFEHEEHLRWVAENADWRRYDFNLNRDSVVIDGGGFDGKWAQEIDNKYACKIFIFEPVAEFYDECVERFKGNPNIKVINAGLSDHDGKATIHLQSNSSSVYISEGNKEEIKLIDFNKWLIENGIDNVDLLKLNIENAEYPLLMSMIKEENMSHLKIDSFLIQFHRGIEHYESMYEAIHNEFKKSHDVVWNFEFVWEFLKRKDN